MVKSMLWMFLVVILTGSLCRSAELLYFGIAGCPHCPAAKKLAEKMQAAGHKVYYLDGERDAAHVAAWRIDAYPTFVVVEQPENGKAKERWRHVGTPWEITLRRKLR